MRKISFLLLTVVLLLVGIHQSARADERHHDDRYHDDRRHDDDWRYHEFRDFDHDRWHHGSWYQGFHEGRDGWWWIVGGIWYFYPSPVYPYPDPYIPPSVALETVPVDTQVAYYCATPAGYYPMVPQCAVQWQQVLQPVGRQPTQVIMTTPVPNPAPMVSQRDVDLQKLNGYAAELQSIDLADPRAKVGLKSLAARVDMLRKDVINRDYNPISMLQNIDDLKKRITMERNQASSMTVVPAQTIPSGSTVTFPGQ